MRRSLASILFALALTASASTAKAGPPTVSSAVSSAAPGSSSSDLSSEMQMAIQMSMQAYTQCMQTISNVMKSASDTAQAIVQNMKS